MQAPIWSYNKARHTETYCKWGNMAHACPHGVLQLSMPQKVTTANGGTWTMHAHMGSYSKACHTQGLPAMGAPWPMCGTIGSYSWGNMAHVSQGKPHKGTHHKCHW